MEPYGGKAGAEDVAAVAPRAQREDVQLVLEIHICTCPRDVRGCPRMSAACRTWLVIERLPLSAVRKRMDCLLEVWVRLSARIIFLP